MAKRDPVRDMVESIALSARTPDAAESIEVFRRALGGRHSLPAARAARAAGEHGLRRLSPELAAAFYYFLRDPAKRDPHCMAKIAVAEALDLLEYERSDLFLDGLRHTQMEAAWGGAVDTAAGLRARCMAALVRLNHPDRYRLLADLLFDPWPEARRGSVHAAAYAGGDEGELLLRIKVRMGDEDLSIVGDCFAGLIQVAPVFGLQIVAAHLRCPERQLREFAALALGESHLPEAFEPLREAILESSDAAEFKTLALAVGLCRTEQAFDLLLEQAATRTLPLASAALEALSLSLSDADRRRRVSETARLRGLSIPG